MNTPHALRQIVLAIWMSSLFGCGSSAAQDAGTTAKMFGETCTMNSDCASAYCGLFDQSGMLCTLSRNGDASVCPDASQGPKCNMKGMCRP